MPNIMPKIWWRVHRTLSHRPWTLQHSATTRLARTTQECLKTEVSRFISTSQWPPKSADANTLDYSAFGSLESKVGTNKYKSVNHLTKTLRRQWDNIPQSHFRSACDGFIGHSSCQRWPIRANRNKF